MDYGNLFSKAWDIVWKNKFLILLGVLATLAGSGGGSGGSQGMSTSGDGSGFQLPGQFQFDPSAPFQSIGLTAAAGLFAIFILAVIVAFWVLGIFARGGLIYGADAISRGQSANFADSFRAAWQKGWRLIGIGLLPAIPILVVIALGFMGAATYTSTSVEIGPNQGSFQTPNIFIFILILVLSLGAFLVLALLRTFADRACMLEDTGVWASYRRGGQVLGENLGPALVLFVLQILLSIGIGLALFLPGILIALCCFLWPLLLLAQGTFAAFYSTLWTLAWNQWTGVPEVVGGSEV